METSNRQLATKYEILYIKLFGGNWWILGIMGRGVEPLGLCIFTESYVPRISIASAEVFIRMNLTRWSFLYIIKTAGAYLGLDRLEFI